MSSSDSSPYFFQRKLWQMGVGERRALLVLGDLIVGGVSLLISLYLWGISEKFSGFSIEFLQKRVPIWFYFLPVIWLLLMIELYDLHRAADWRRTLRGIATAAVFGFLFYLFLYFYYVNPPTSLLPRRGVASFVLAVAVLTLVWRRLYIRVFAAPQFSRRVLLVGGGKNGQTLLKMINQLPIKPFLLIGIIDDDHRKLGTYIEEYQVIGTGDQLLDIVINNQITDIIVAISGQMRPSLFQTLLKAQQLGVEITRMPIMYEELLNRVPIHSLEADWLLRSFVDEARVSPFFELIKRGLDIVGGIIGVLITIILFPLIALLIWLDDGLPIFYTQTRSGRGGVPYNIVKFRTMKKDAEPEGRPMWAKEDDERATRVGRFLRKTHLDELPQFFNVLRGDMSLVGPRAERPELVEHFDKHIPFYRARLLVKPGITGWAQINFGYAANIEETTIKLEYDLYYIKNRNLFLDILILLRTPATILGLKGR